MRSRLIEVLVRAIILVVLTCLHSWNGFSRRTLPSTYTKIDGLVSFIKYVLS